MQHRHFLVIPWFLALTALAGCAKSDKPLAVDCAGVHYCLGAFVQQELQSYATAQPSLEKYAYLNGKEETKTLQLDAARWQVEFTAFKEADIDRPALRGKYLVDTLYMDTDSLTKVSYIAQDPDLRTQYLHLYFKPNATTPSYIEAHLATSNVFYQSQQDIAFAPGEFYSISGYQDIWLLGEDSFAVKSVFVK